MIGDDDVADVGCCDGKPLLERLDLQRTTGCLGQLGSRGNIVGLLLP